MYITNLVVAFLLGIYVCGETAKRLTIKDPSSIVWDEFVGLWIALLFTPTKWYFIVLTFVIFRLFDIFKPWPIGFLDRELKGGVGIMLDDAAAGLLTLFLVQLLANGMINIAPK